MGYLFEGYVLGASSVKISPLHQNISTRRQTSNLPRDVGVFSDLICGGNNGNPCAIPSAFVRDVNPKRNGRPPSFVDITSGLTPVGAPTLSCDTAPTANSATAVKKESILVVHFPGSTKQERWKKKKPRNRTKAQKKKRRKKKRRETKELGGSTMLGTQKTKQASRLWVASPVFAHFIYGGTCQPLHIRPVHLSLSTYHPLSLSTDRPWLDSMCLPPIDTSTNGHISE